MRLHHLVRGKAQLGQQDAAMLDLQSHAIVLQGFHPEDFQRGRQGGNQGPSVHPDMMQPGPSGGFDTMYS